MPLCADSYSIISSKHNCAESRNAGITVLKLYSGPNWNEKSVMKDGSLFN
jgi:hypothetical protein